jgi:hypothetical protein
MVSGRQDNVRVPRVHNLQNRLATRLWFEGIPLFGDARLATPMVPKQIVAQAFKPDDESPHRARPFPFWSVLYAESGSVFTIDQPAAAKRGILQERLTMGSDS